MAVAANGDYSAQQITPTMSGAPSSVAPPTSAATGGAMTPAQLAAIYAAGQAGDTSAYGHGTGNDIESSIYSSLQGSGDFSAAQLAGLSSDGISGGGAWGNGAPPGDSWTGQITNALNQTPNAANTSGLSQTQTDTAGFAPSVQQLQASQPLSYSNFGTLPTLGTSTYNASTPQAAGSVTGTSIDPQQSQQYLNQAAQAQQAVDAPIFAQQNEALDEQMASRGIFNSGAAQQSANNLAGTQASTYNAALSPYISAAQGYAQQDSTLNAQNAQQANLANQSTQATQNDYAAQLQQQANAGNAASSNATNEYNATNYLNQTQNDQNAYNTYQQYLLQQGIGNYNTLNGAYLNTYAPANSTALSGLNNGASQATSAYNNAYGNSASGTAGLGSLFAGAAKNAITAPATGGSSGPVTYAGAPNPNDVQVTGDPTGLGGDL